jgi:hypothetical protein
MTTGSFEMTSGPFELTMASPLPTTGAYAVTNR